MHTHQSHCFIMRKKKHLCYCAHQFELRIVNYLHFAFYLDEKSVELLITGCCGEIRRDMCDLITYIFVKVAERRNVDYSSLGIVHQANIRYF